MDTVDINPGVKMGSSIILCVDDDVVVLNALRSLIVKALGSGNVVEIAETGEEALEICAELQQEGREISVVISDFIMPGMRGDELLIRLHEISPHTIKIMLTGQSDLQGLKRTINDSNLYRFLEKPFNNDDLMLTVKSAFKTYLQANELERQNAALRIAAVAFESQEAILITDAHSTILNINKAFTEITGYTASEVVGKKPSLLKSGRHDADFYREMWHVLEQQGIWQGEIWDRRKNGETYPKILTISSVKNCYGVVSHYVGAFLDITERKKAEAKIQYLAFFDQLTGLPNRSLLLDRLKQAMATSSRNGSHGALLFIDLDHFKTINDTMGHDMGDQLLVQVAQRLIPCVREGDTLARLGSDDFVVVLAGLSQDETDAAREVEAIAEQILAALNQTYPLGDVIQNSSASIGITLFSGDQCTVDDLMKQADLSMYKSKEAGRNAFCFFDPGMEASVRKRVTLEQDLRQAIEQHQFQLYYQAQVLGDGQLTGAEALVRWLHPQRGLVSPADFIPLAEETGLILPLGRWILAAACSQLATWNLRPEMAMFSLAVNVSALQFRQADFVNQVLEILENTGVNPQRLKIELTESLLVDNVLEIIEKMHVLKARGIRFSLDDFGTGYSSLAYLKRLPLDQLKIDQSFVREILSNPNDAAIVKTIVALAQSLGFGVISEGVETEAQRSFLVSSGCHSHQGYYFSKPLPLEAFEEFARQFFARTKVQPS